MRRRTAVGLSAALAVVALIAGLSVVWPGLDAQETPPKDPSVWVLQTDGLRYARVNTAVGELDTVRSVANPSRLVEAPTGAFVFTDSDSKVTRINEAEPVDLDADGQQGAAVAPPGTRQVESAGDFVAYRTDTGAVYAGRLSTDSVAQVDPYASEGENDAQRRQYTAAAIAVDARGMLFAYSSESGSVLRFDIASSGVRGEDKVSANAAEPAISSAGDEWILVDQADGTYWSRRSDSGTSAGTTGTVVVSEPDPDGDSVYLADETELVRIPAKGGAAELVFGGASSLGAAARPVAHDGIVYAAWLPTGTGDGTLWNSRDRQSPLLYGGGSLPDQRRPVFVTTGDAIVLNEARTGWVWTISDGSGTLVPSSQDWELDNKPNPATAPSDEEVPVVIEPKPPVAVADAFGVRAGALVALPVLLNDHDPNEDVLSIDPSSVVGLDPAFGTVTMTDDQQRLAVRVVPDAKGTGTFTYAVTDGTTDGGLLSASVAVTLTVIAPSQNSAPVWCGVPDCQQDWPTPQIGRNATITVPVLAGWVDPEGDPLLLLSAGIPSGVGTAASTPAGDVVYQHTDSGDGAEGDVDIELTVADTHGEISTRSLVISVRGDPEPEVQSFAVLDMVGSGLSVDVAPHVTGATGDMTLTAARVLDDAAATATVVGATTRFDFTAAEPGTYRVAVTVLVSGREAIGTVRITLLPSDAPPDLSTAPVVAFVHPQADATIDVFAAVSNPTRRVLLLSDVTASPEPGASLSVDGVAQSQLRVSGTTATGESGPLGTVSYRVSDGTNDQGASVEGKATVYLLPPTVDAAPIAVDDALVVRAGAQVDIPVLDNDISPSGGVPRIDPESIVSSSDQALAFASGDVVRYLAPTQPGDDYTIEYRIFTAGAPTLADTATVRVRVLGADANRAPLPDNLFGRVLSGLSTTIPFDGFGVDPDGDAIRLDRIVTQPTVGSAALSADGSAMTYTSVPGDAGQQSFTYSVVDEFGEQGQATVRIGVLGGDANPSPVTYTDYVAVQAGLGSTVTVSALANDLDPTQGTLSITDVRPDTPEETLDGGTSAEYARLSSMIQATSEDEVVIAAGAEPETLSFLYDVESTSGNTARGLIVMKVVRDRVPAYPVVTDTTLTDENRDDFMTGVDVVSGKVTWTAGDVDDLSVGLWGDQSGVRVSGDELRGQLTDSRRIIPFAVFGVGPTGPVKTYAFLRIPSTDDLRPSLRSGTQSVSVDELAEVTFDMSSLVARARDRGLEVGSDVKAAGGRTAATCERVGSTRIIYHASAGAPWADACQIPVRFEGQSDWTILSVPITVVALEPQPILRSGAVSVAPGDTATFDLTSLTSWQLRADWGGIRYGLQYQSASFTITQAGSILTITGKDTAVPGIEESAVITVTSHAAVAPARLILRVGAAPSALPRGGSAGVQCTQASGGNCSVEVVGAVGELNPLPGTPLEVVDVQATGTCTGITFSVSSSSRVTASWTADAPGATCTASFRVRDAQGRTSSGERNGSITLDLQGFPQVPASIVQSAFGDSSLTLRVDPGGSRVAYPALTGFVIRSAGAVVAQCTAQGVCPEITAPNGEKRLYEAFAFNSVGESLTSVTTTAWAYAAPVQPAAAVASPVVTAGDGGVVSLTVTGIDAENTGTLQISSPVGETITVPAAGVDTVFVPAFRVGSNTATDITITPLTRFELPPVVGANAAGIARVVLGNGIGSPGVPALTLVATSTPGGTAMVVATASAGSGGDGSQLQFGIVQDGQTCTVSQGGDARTFTGLPDGRLYRFIVCVESWAAGQVYGRSMSSGEVRAVQSSAPPTGYTFVVGPTPHYSGDSVRWTIDAAPTSQETPPFDNTAVVSGYPTGVFDVDPGISVRYEHQLGWWQSAWGAVTPAPGSAPYQVQARWWIDSCVGGSLLTPQSSPSVDGAGRGARIRFVPDQISYLDAAGAVLVPTDPWTVPVGTAQVTGIGVAVDWSTQGWNLQPANALFSAPCNPNLPPPIIPPEAPPDPPPVP